MIESWVLFFKWISLRPHLTRASASRNENQCHFRVLQRLVTLKPIVAVRIHSCRSNRLQAETISLLSSIIRIDVVSPCPPPRMVDSYLNRLSQLSDKLEFGFRWGHARGDNAKHTECLCGFKRVKVGSKVLGEGGFHKKKGRSNPCLVCGISDSGLELDYGKLTVAVSPVQRLQQAPACRHQKPEEPLFLDHSRRRLYRSWLGTIQKIV